MKPPKAQQLFKPDKSQLARRSKIIELAKSALDNAEQTKGRARLAINEAAECGRLLIVEKMALKESGIRGKWCDYFEATFGRYLPFQTARGWMKIAEKAKTEPRPNVTRAGMLALELFPAKVYHKSEDVKNNESLNFTNILSVMNKFVAWRMRFAERVAIGELTTLQIEQLKKDCAPIIEFVQQLMSGTLPEAQKQKVA
jgi:hypothetical protein